MLSRSCFNLLNLDDYSSDQTRIPRVISMAGIISDFEEGGSNLTIPQTDGPPATNHGRRIIVANQLPLRCISKEPSEEGLRWSFEWDEDSLFLQLKDGFPPDVEVLYVGCLGVEIDPHDEEEVGQLLLDKFNCVPTFLPSELYGKFYDGFCKHYLWPLFHYMLPMTTAYGGRFDKDMWSSYVSVNRIFSSKVIEVLSPEDDYVWIHDYHLMILPTVLRKNCDKIRVGFFLHSPFPVSEIFRTIPVWEDILRGFLNSDLIGFHTYDYARHFLSCCSRMLGLDYRSKRGYIGLEYYGRTVGVKILPVGIHMGRIRSIMSDPATAIKIKELKRKYKGKTLLLGVDDMDLFKGISLKFLAFQQLLLDNPDHRGNVVLVQIMNPPRSIGKDVLDLGNEIDNVADEVNKEYGFAGYEPIVCVNGPVSYQDKVAYYAISECVVVNCIRDGMNLVPYKYTVSRESIPELDEALDLELEMRKNSIIIVSEFIGCTPSLCGAIRVNPLNVSEVADAMDTGIRMSSAGKEARHERHYRYIESHDVTHWTRSFDQDLQRACSDHFNRSSWKIGIGLCTKIVVSSNDFRRLNFGQIENGYSRTKSRVIFLDYDGTLMPLDRRMDKSPSPRVISVLERLCADVKNMVFIVSGRGRDQLSRWFSQCKNLGLAAEHGFFLRMPSKSNWDSGELSIETNCRWKRIVLPIMQHYTEATDGSSIEEKETAMVWHNEDADPDFGSWQAKELVDQLETVLAIEPVVVNRGQQIVEVKPPEANKGKVVKKVLDHMRMMESPADFVLCVGDDKSDEDMIDMVQKFSDLSWHSNVFTCTVGQKPSKAKYYLDDTTEVMAMLEGLTIRPAFPPPPGVSSTAPSSA